MNKLSGLNSVLFIIMAGTVRNYHGVQRVKELQRNIFNDMQGK
jgi:hypothetical protein